MAENNDLSTKPWDGASSNYQDADAYAAACLVDTNPPGQPKVKNLCHLPVREPNGAYNRTALGAAAAALVGGRGGVELPPAVKKAAAKKLAGLYARFNLPVPASLKNMAS